MQFWLKVLIFVTVTLSTMQCNQRQYGDKFSLAKTTANRGAHKRDYSFRSENVESSVGNHTHKNNYYSNSRKSESEFSTAESHSVNKRLLSNGFGRNDKSLVTASSVTSNFESEKSQSQTSRNSVNYSNGSKQGFSLQKESSNFLKRAEAFSSTSSSMSSNMTGLNINNDSALDSTINQGLLGDNIWAKESHQSQGQLEKEMEDVSNHLYENSKEHKELEGDISNHFQENSQEHKKFEMDISDYLHKTSHSQEETQIDISNQLHKDAEEHKKYDLDTSGNSYESSHEHKTYDLGFSDHFLENSNIQEEAQTDILRLSHENFDEHKKYDLNISRNSHENSHERKTYDLGSSDQSLKNSNLHEEAQIDILHHSHENSDEHKKYDLFNSDQSHENFHEQDEISLNILDHSHENSHLHDEAQIDILHHSHESSDEHKNCDLVISDHSHENSQEHNELGLNISGHSYENSHLHDEAEIDISHLSHEHTQEHLEHDLEISDHSYENSHSHEEGRIYNTIHSTENRVEHNINKKKSEENWSSLESFEIFSNNSRESSNLEKCDQDIQQQANVNKTNNLHITESEDLKPELLYPDMDSEVKYSNTFEDFDEAGTPNFLMSSEENKESQVTEGSTVKPYTHILPYPLYPVGKLVQPKPKDEIHILPHPNRSEVPEKMNDLRTQPYPYSILPTKPKPENGMPILPYSQSLDKSSLHKPKDDMVIQSNPYDFNEFHRSEKMPTYPISRNAPYTEYKHPYYLINRQKTKPFKNQHNDHLDENNQCRFHSLGLQKYSQPFQPQHPSMSGYPEKGSNSPRRSAYYPARTRHDNYPEENLGNRTSGRTYRPYPSDRVLPPRQKGQRRCTPEEWCPDSVNTDSSQSNVPEEKSQPLQVLSQTGSLLNGPVSPLTLLKPLSHTLNKSLSALLSPLTHSGINPKLALPAISVEIHPNPISLSAPTAVLSASELPSVPTNSESTAVFASPSTPTGTRSRLLLPSTPINIDAETLLPSTPTGVHHQPISFSTPTGVHHQPICNCDKFSSSFTSSTAPTDIHPNPSCSCSVTHPICLESSNIQDDITKTAVDSAPLPLTQESTALPPAVEHSLNGAQSIIKEIESPSSTLSRPVVDEHPLPSTPWITKPSIPDNNSVPSAGETIIISPTLPKPNAPCEKCSTMLPTIAPVTNLTTASVPVPRPLIDDFLSYVSKELQQKLKTAKLTNSKVQKLHVKDATRELELADDETSLSYTTVVIGSQMSALSALKPLLERGKRVLLVDNVELPPVEAASIYHRVGLIGTPYVTSYAATAPQCDADKKVHVARVLGGTSNYDLGVWDYGAAHQYAKWGNTCLNWSWRILSRYYQQLEKGENVDGCRVPPINVCYGDVAKSGLAAHLINAFDDVGITQMDWKPATPRQYCGTTFLPSTYAANYSDTFVGRIFEDLGKGGGENLTLALGVRIKRLVFEHRTRVVAVEFITSSGQIRTINVADELIVADDPVNTIKLLQVSGLGDGYYLREQGIPVQRHLPFVGKDVLLYPMYPGLLIKCAPGTLVDVRDSDYSAIDSLFGDSNMQSTVASTYFKAFSQVYDAEEANLQINVYTFSNNTVQRLKYFTRGLFDFDERTQEYVAQLCSNNDLMFFAPQLLETESKAEVHVNGGDYATPPIIRTNLYDNERDLLVMRKAVRLIERVAGALIRQIGAGELVQVPVEKCGHATLEKTFLECSIRHLTVPSIHLTGGTIMGYDEYSSVVDENLRVHGVHNLYVVGPSVIPNGLSADSSAISSVIGRYGADLILGNHPTIPESD